MRAVMLEVPQALLDERRARGADRWDEMWEGELHMLPPPSVEHQRVGSELFLVLGPLARGRGLVPLYDTTGVFRPGVDDDWRCPDGRMVPVEPADIQCLGVRAETVDGRLRLTWEGGSADI